GFGHRIDVAHVEQQAVDLIRRSLILNQLGNSADARGNRGNAAGHGFESGQAEGLHLAGHQHQVGQRKEFVDVVLLADEVNAVLDPELESEILGGAAVGAIADEHKPRGHSGSNAGEDFDDVLNALDRSEVGEMNEEALVRSGEAWSHSGDELRIANVDVAVDEVLDDFNLGGDAEGLAGAVAEIAGDGGDTIGFDDAESGDRQVGVIESHEGDVGA